MGFQGAGKISWENDKELHMYTKNVETSLNNILIETRRLRKLHLDLVQVVNSLF